jgi:hypothetical protein
VTTLYLVLALLGNVPHADRQDLVTDAAIAVGVCVPDADDGDMLCGDGVSDVWDLLAEEGIEVPACDPRDGALGCWSMADSLDPIAGL